MSRGWRVGLGVLVVLALLASVGVYALGRLRGIGPLAGPERCVAEVDGHRVTLSPEQAGNAALITALSVQRGMPARAATIALATAYQESGMLNIEHGDRDSVGLFQQRPSQGWGTVEQILDPVYATNRFYDALAKVSGYREMEITVAAQTVQRSAHPEAYAKHEADARVLASALTGNSPEAFWCSLADDEAEDVLELDEAGLVPRAAAVREEIDALFGVPLGGFEPRGVSTGHMRGSAHYEGRAIDAFVRPVNAENRKLGWAIAHYLVAQADRLAIETVIFDDRIWKAGRDEWRDYRVPSSSRGDRAILEHRDHVHVDTAR
ncbi:MAG: hypothetical protein ACI379_10340 [Nocardioides sp.]|uniref:hypothetical protein n=1 Tax=Nocardioides sp. TaxID=35761 RepID=UPI003EFC8CA8